MCVFAYFWCSGYLQRPDGSFVDAVFGFCLYIDAFLTVAYCTCRIQRNPPMHFVLNKNDINCEKFFEAFKTSESLDELLFIN